MYRPSFFLRTLGFAAIALQAAGCASHSVTSDVITCGPGSADCGGVCSTLGDDNANCGACGRACGANERCTGGFCLAACGEGTTACGARCASTSSDHENCGSCGRRCLEGEVCSGGACGLSCGAGLSMCAESSPDAGPADASVAAHCANVVSDNRDCGSCGHACGPTETCSAGACAQLCGDNMSYCSGACVDTRRDPSHCGSCSNVCDSSSRCVLHVCRPNDELVFVTSEVYTGALGGFAGADAKCNGLATKSGLTGAYKAWLSGSLSASDRLVHSAKPYRLVDGTMVATSWVGLTTSPPLHAIDLTELDAKVPSDCLIGCGYATVHTNSREDGSTVSPQWSCADWFGNSGLGVVGRVGLPNNLYWSYQAFGGTCGYLAHLYCFEQ